MQFLARHWFTFGICCETFIHWTLLWYFTCFPKTSYLSVSRNVSKHHNQQVWKGASILVNSLILQNGVAACKLPVRKSPCNTPNYQTVPVHNCRAGKSKLAQAKSVCRTTNTILALACAPMLIDIPVHSLIYSCRKSFMACECLSLLLSER